MENQPVLDGMSLLPLLDGKETKRARPIGFWNWPRKNGFKTPAKQWMEELLADQAAGREPNDPMRVRPDAAEIKEQVPTNSFPGHAAWLDGTWKLHRIQDVKTGDVKWELYDLAADPDESRELYAEQPERVPQMQQQLEDWLESVTHSLNGKDYK
jgi:arylsulfatase A-like enzyme